MRELTWVSEQGLDVSVDFVMELNDIIATINKVVFCFEMSKLKAKT